MKGIDRYLRLIHWARKRYTQPDGYLIKSVGRVPSTYSRIELAAARKHLKLIGA